MTQILFLFLAVGACRTDAVTTTDDGTDATTDLPPSTTPPTPTPPGGTTPGGTPPSGTPPTGTPPTGTPPTGTPPTGTTTRTFDAELDAVCVNELMPSNASAYNVGGAYPDWIELHNASTTDVVLDGWSMSDDEDEPTQFVFPAGSTLAAGAFLILFADGDVAAGPTHLPFSLDADGDDVGLYAPNGDGEVFHFGALVDDVAAARTEDCGPDTWATVWMGTPGASNE